MERAQNLKGWTLNKYERMEKIKIKSAAMELIVLKYCGQKKSDKKKFAATAIDVVKKKKAFGNSLPWIFFSLYLTV